MNMNENRVNKELQNYRKRFQEQQEKDKSRTDTEIESARFLEGHIQSKKQKEQEEINKLQARLQHVRILSDGSGVYRDVIDSLKKKVYGDDFKMIKTVNEFEGLLSSKPFISDYYLVEFVLIKPNKQDIEKIKQLMVKNKYMRIIFVLDNKATYDQFDFCTYSFNTYRLTEKYFMNYLDKRLTIPSLLSKEEKLKLYRKLQGKFGLLDTVIRRLNNLENFKKVSRTTKISKDIPFDKFFYILMLGDKVNIKTFSNYKTFDYSQVKRKFFNYVENFIYGHKFILKSIKTECEFLNELYKIVLAGDLNVLNIHAYCSEHNMKEYKVNLYYDIIKKLSYDRFLLIREIVDNTKERRFDVFTMLFHILNMDRIGGLKIGKE